MKDTFDVLHELFQLFKDDTVLTGHLGIVDVNDMEVCDTKIRRRFADASLIKPEELPFVDFSYIASNSVTANYLVNKESLEFNVYTSSFSNADDISKSLKRILSKNYEDMKGTSPVQAGCPVPGILRYRFIVKSLVSS